MMKCGFYWCMGMMKPKSSQSKIMFLENKVRTERRSDNLAAIFEPIV
jgi:hypothetical protein